MNATQNIRGSKAVDPDADTVCAATELAPVAISGHSQLVIVDIAGYRVARDESIDDLVENDLAPIIPTYTAEQLAVIAQVDALVRRHLERTGR